MLITKEVITRWNPNTRKYYEGLGYIYTKCHESFNVKIEDLHKGSNIYIEFECDICKQNFQRQYGKYNNLRNKYGIDMCGRCIVGIISQNTQKTNNTNYGGYETHEKRKLALDKYLKEYKTIESMRKNKEGNRLYSNFSKRKDNVCETAIELGYDVEQIYKQIPNNYYINHPDVLIKKLTAFIEEYKRFPILNEMTKTLRINGQYIVKMGGINYFKNLISYNDEKDLVDLRGDYNKSIGELITANYLCSQGLKDYYDREVNPFPKEAGNYRSDFTFCLENNDLLHVEVWGITENGKGVWAEQYQETRKIKESLYKECNVNYIGIEYNIFNKKYDEIQNELYKIFSPFLQLKFKKISYKKLLSSSSMTDDEIAKEVISLSEIDKTFPSTKKLQTYCASLYNEILKRGYTYLEFANKYGYTLLTRDYEWSKKQIFSQFDKMVEQNIYINKKNIKLFNSALNDATESYGYLFKLKIEYFVDRDIIPEQELQWIINLANNRTKTTGYNDDNDVKLAKQLLDKHYIDYYKESTCQMCKKKIIMLHIYDIYCEDCLEDIHNGNIVYSKTRTPYTEKQYEDNFYKYIKQPHALTTKVFDDMSPIKVQAYRNYFGLVWIDVLKRYNKYNDFLNYIVDEYIQFYNRDFKKNFLVFGSEHKYLTRGLVEYVNQDDLYSLLNQKLQQQSA